MSLYLGSDDGIPDTINESEMMRESVRQGVKADVVASKIESRGICLIAFVRVLKMVSKQDMPVLCSWICRVTRDGSQDCLYYLSAPKEAIRYEMDEEFEV